MILRQALIVAGSLAILLGLAVVVLRLGMRPLDRMARTADAIAAGSLSERLAIGGDRSETDRVAEAVNSAFDAQAAPRQRSGPSPPTPRTNYERRCPQSQGGWTCTAKAVWTSPGWKLPLEHIDNEVGRMRLLVEDLGLLARLDAGRPIDFDDIDMTALADSTPEECSVVVELRRRATNVEVRVIDDGPGIAADDLPRVFERFWRAEASRSRAYGGSGLGLAIVEAITHAHRGHVDVRSTLGVGTVVTVTLPAGSRRK